MNALAIDTATTALGLCLQTEAAVPPAGQAARRHRKAGPSLTPRPAANAPAAAAPHLRTYILQIGLKHSEKLMPALRSLLSEAGLPAEELDLIICSTGPGSFTGIRIGLATAKGLADGVRAAGVRPAGVPATGREGSCRLIGVSTLDGLAYRFRRFPGWVAAVNPSLRKKYYAAVYRTGKLEGDYLETMLPDLSDALRTKRPLLITGAAAGALYELILADGGKADSDLVVDASGQSCDPSGLLACGIARLGEPESEPLPLYLRKSEAEITFFGE